MQPRCQKKCHLLCIKAMNSLFAPEIPKRSSSCVHCQQILHPGSDYCSILLKEKEGYQRQDFCMSCGKEKCSETKAVSWKSRVPLQQKAPQFNDKMAKALFLLKENQQKQSPDEYGESFILALLLSRKRKLSMRFEEKDVQYYEVIETEEILPIQKMEISTLDIDRIQKTLAEKING